MKNAYRTIFFATLAFLNTLACEQSFAFSSTSQDDAVAKTNASFDANSQTATVSLKIPEGVKYNLEGPWKLEISGPMQSLGNVKTPFGKDDFNKSTQSFSISIKQKITTADASKSKWNLTYFLCNTANTWCKRLSATGVFQ